MCIRDSGKTDDEVGLHQGMTENEAWAYADSNIDQYAPIPWCGFVNWDDYLFRNGSHQNYEFSDVYKRQTHCQILI